MHLHALAYVVPTCLYFNVSARRYGWYTKALTVLYLQSPYVFLHQLKRTRTHTHTHTHAHTHTHLHYITYIVPTPLYLNVRAHSHGCYINALTLSCLRRLYVSLRQRDTHTIERSRVHAHTNACAHTDTYTILLTSSLRLITST